MKRQKLLRQIMSLGLLFSLILPMALDALHYAIFHHHEEDQSSGLVFQANESSHIVCSFPFVTKEYSENIFYIHVFERILDIWVPAEISISKVVSYFPNPLRGPPLRIIIQ